ncbi:MAG: GAF domain-containing protein [Chloroflexi bacterium]|nr:GAF domain-containing protein [Chloroflexota bacterium]
MAKPKLPAEPMLERDLMADRARELLVLNAIAAAVASSLEPLPLLASALDHVLDLLDLDAGAIYTSEDEQMQLIVHRGIAGEQLDEYGVIGLDQPLLLQVAAEGKPMILADLRALPELESLATDACLCSMVGLPLFARGDVAGILIVFRSKAHAFTPRGITLLEAIADHIALALDNARLFAAEQQRRRHAETLRVAAAAVGSTLDLSSVLETILAQLQKVVSYRSATVQLREDDAVRVIAVRGFANDEELPGIRFPLTDDHPNSLVIKAAQTMRLADAQAAYSTFDDPGMSHIRSWMGVPLCYGGHAIGMITLDRSELNAFTAAEARLAESFAQQAALAIENARLFAAEQQRRRLSEALRKGALALTEALGLDAVLRRIMQQATELMETPMCALYELDPSTNQLTPRNAWGFVSGHSECISRLGEQIVGTAIKANHAVSVPNVQAAEWQREHDLNLPTELPFQSILAAPLMVKGRIYGGIVVYYEHARQFSADEVQLLDIFADQAALALEHARLVDQSRQLAALEERQRIARDLHDSVTQTLFSLTLAAQAARTTAATDLQAADSMLETVQSLASGALAEMRALIFELRPGALREAGLAAAIERFVGAFRSRTGIDVEMDLDSTRLPETVEEALYRIASEALANVGKHACANHVKVTVCLAQTGVELRVRDNGVGFDPYQPVAGDHMGQRTMQERAAALGGSCVVLSQIGSGTEVVVNVPLAQSE